MENEIRATVNTSSLSFSTILFTGNTNAEIRVKGNLQVSPDNFITIYLYFDKVVGDPIYIPFSPYTIVLDNRAPQRESVSNVDMDCGPMKLHITQVWYTTSQSNNYTVNLTANWTDSEGNGYYSVYNDAIGSFVLNM